MSKSELDKWTRKLILIDMNIRLYKYKYNERKYNSKYKYCFLNRIYSRSLFVMFL